MNKQKNLLKCPICHEELKSFSKIASSIILKCRKCGLGNPKNLKSQQSDYHRDKIYIEEEKLFKNIFLKRVNIICRFKKEGKALEIGCSTGLFLSLLHNRGWQVHGVEISTKAAEEAQKRGVKVTIHDFMRVSINEKFDAVILNHTLEHLENPAEVIKKINNLLSPGGFIFIDVPNFGGLSAKLLGTKWPLLLPTEHLWHFTEKSLEILLKKQGFKIIFTEKASGVWDYNNPLWGILLSLVTLKKRFFSEFFTAIPSWLVTKLGLGSDLMIIAKKI